jgi:hypothetical protein
VTEAQLAQLHLEFLFRTSPVLRVGQVSVEYLYRAAPQLRVGQVVIEYLYRRSTARWFLLPIQS